MTDPMRLAPLLAQNLRAPVSWDATGNPVFDPPLTAAEQTTLDDLRTMLNFGVTLSLAEWQSIKADAAGLKAYNGLASPTLAQTISATKAQNRILAVIIRS